MTPGQLHLATQFALAFLGLYAVAITAAAALYRSLWLADRRQVADLRPGKVLMFATRARR